MIPSTIVNYLRIPLKKSTLPKWPLPRGSSSTDPLQCNAMQCSDLQHRQKSNPTRKSVPSYSTNFLPLRFPTMYETLIQPHILSPFNSVPHMLNSLEPTARLLHIARLTPTAVTHLSYWTPTPTPTLEDIFLIIRSLSSPQKLFFNFEVIWCNCCCCC